MTGPPTNDNVSQLTFMLYLDVYTNSQPLLTVLVRMPTTVSKMMIFLYKIGTGPVAGPPTNVNVQDSLSFESFG